MSSQIVEVCAIEKVAPNLNSDRLDIVHIKGWQVVTQRDKYKVGDKVVFVPDGYIIPEELAIKLGVKGYLASNNRTKVVRLRGEVSYGLLIEPLSSDWPIGKDVAIDYGITKYTPKPDNSTGHSKSTKAAKKVEGFDKYTEIENINHYPDALNGCTVSLVEKVHGNNFRIGRVNGQWVGGSKNVARKVPIWTRLPTLKEFISRIFSKEIFSSLNKLEFVDQELCKNDRFLHALSFTNVIGAITYLEYFDKSVIFYGEIFGPGIQTMKYGKESLDYVIFDIKVGDKFLDADAFNYICSQYGLKTPPIVKANIPYDLAEVKKHSTGPSLIDPSIIREGVIVRPDKEMVSSTYTKTSRMIYKSINPDYLIGKYSVDANAISDNESE